MYQILQKFDIHWHDGGPSIAMMYHLRRVSDLLCNWKSCLLCYMKDVVLHCSIFFKWNKLVRVRVRVRVRVAQHMGKRCEIIAVRSATAVMTPLCSHTNGIKQTYPTCWSCQYSRFMINLRSNTLIIHLRCSENATIRPIWLLDARMLKTILVAIKLT